MTPHVSACPGFSPAPVATGPHDAVGEDTVISCRHLRAARARLGYIPGCWFPGGLPEGAAEVAAAHVGRRRRS